MNNRQMMENISSRIAVYNRAIAIKSGIVPADDSYELPEGDISSWELVIRELRNVRDELAKLNTLVADTPLGHISAVIKGDFDYPGFYVVTGDSFEKGDIIAMIEADRYVPEIHTVPYTASDDEPVTVVSYAYKERKYHQDIVCSKCDTKLVWEHPSTPGLFLKSSAFMDENIPLCYDCLASHCQATKCSKCKLGVFPTDKSKDNKCKFYSMMKEDVPY